MHDNLGQLFVRFALPVYLRVSICGLQQQGTQCWRAKGDARQCGTTLQYSALKGKKAQSPQGLKKKLSILSCMHQVLAGHLAHDFAHIQYIQPQHQYLYTWLMQCNESLP